MLASFTKMDCESQNQDNGNPLRFYPLEKRSNASGSVSATTIARGFAIMRYLTQFFLHVTEGLQRS